MSSFGPYHATSSRILLCLDGDSGDLSGSAISTFTFNETVAFPYFCTIHQSMTGTITVVEG